MVSLEATPSAIQLIHQFLLRARLLIQPYLTNGLCPASLLGPTRLPRLLLEAMPLQQAATLESSSLPQLSIRKTLPGLAGHSWHSTCLESHPDVETTPQHPLLPCPLCSALEWSENSARPILLIREGRLFFFFSKFHLAACLQEWIRYTQHRKHYMHTGDKRE